MEEDTGNQDIPGKSNFFEFCVMPMKSDKIDRQFLTRTAIGCLASSR